MNDEVNLTTEDLFGIIGKQHAEILGLRKLLKQAQEKAAAMTAANAMLLQRNGKLELVEVQSD